MFPLKIGTTNRTCILLIAGACCCLGARSLHADEPTEEEQKIADSRETWESVKEECGGNYEYSIVLTSEEGGFGSETVIVVRDGEVTERRYRGFRLRQPKPPWEWTETGDTLGTHGGAAALKTLDDLYDQAETIAAMELEPHQRRYIGLDNRGLLRKCCWFDTRIADDDNGHGVNIGSITPVE